MEQISYWFYTALPDASPITGDYSIPGVASLYAVHLRRVPKPMGQPWYNLVNLTQSGSMLGYSLALSPTYSLVQLKLSGFVCASPNVPINVTVTLKNVTLLGQIEVEFNTSSTSWCTGLACSYDAVKKISVTNFGLSAIPEVSYETNTNPSVGVFFTTIEENVIGAIGTTLREDMESMARASLNKLAIDSVLQFQQMKVTGPDFECPFTMSSDCATSSRATSLWQQQQCR